MLKYEWSQGKFTLYTENDFPLGTIEYNSTVGFMFKPYKTRLGLHGAYKKLEPYLPRFNNVEALQYVILGIYLNTSVEVEI